MTIKVCICVISMLVSMIVVVSVCIMVLAEVMKSEFVPIMLTKVDCIMVFNDCIVWRKLAESCLLYRWAFVEAFSREDISVFTLSSSTFAYVSDASVFFISFELVLHL